MNSSRFAAILTLVALAGCANQSPQLDARKAFVGDSDRYVVVTVRNRDTLMPRAGSTPRDYDVLPSYRVSAVARKQVRALASAHGLREVDGWPIAMLGVHCVVFELPVGLAQSEALRLLERDARVESAQPLNAFATLSSDADPYRGLQHSLDTMQVSAAHAWSRGENVRVAIVDTGIDSRHPDLGSRVVLEKNFVDPEPRAPAERHGTAIAGVIAAIDNNREGIVGVAPAASLIALRACWERGDANSTAACNTFTLAKALAAAIEGRTDIVNLSFGGPPDPLLERIVEQGAKRGIIYVGALPQGARGFPCSTSHVICVGIAGESIDGAQLFAPGREVLTLIPAGRYDFVSGSSLAAANVSASIALLRSREPDLTTTGALSLLAPSVRALAHSPAPSINVCEALARLLGKEGCSPVDR